VFAANAMSANASPVMMDHMDSTGQLYNESLQNDGNHDDGSDGSDDDDDNDDEVDEDDFRLPNFGKTARTASAAYVSSSNHAKVCGARSGF
jgi:hypothetical protein